MEPGATWVVYAAEYARQALELLGIGVIVCSATYALVYGIVGLVRHVNAAEVFRTLRQRLGRGILLGLEFLVAGDIISTVAIELNFHTVGTLALIVLIRTFLSWSLEVELTGSWPWHASRAES